MRADERLGWLREVVEVDCEVEVGMEVDVVEEAAVATVAGMMVVVKTAGMTEAVVWVAAHQQLQRGRRADCGLVAVSDGCACSSLDRCGRCMAVQPVPHPAGRRADGGWTPRCTTICCCHLASTGCLSTLHIHGLDSESLAAQSCLPYVAVPRRSHSASVPVSATVTCKR